MASVAKPAVRSDPANEVLMSRSNDMDDAAFISPITSVIIVADKNRCPPGFSVITRTYDEQTDADLWRESSFAFFSRPVRYIAISRDTPTNATNARVVTDLCIVKDSNPIPMGFTAIDYTVDSKEKSLRKKFLCVRTVGRDAVMDAVGEIILLSKLKKPPVNYSSAGEIDGVLVCFKHVVIPSTFGFALPRSRSSTSGLYPSMGDAFRHSDPALDKGGSKPPGSSNVLTIKSPLKKGVDDVPFKLNPLFENSLARNQIQALPELRKCDRQRLDRDFHYQFTLERAIL